MHSQKFRKFTKKITRNSIGLFISTNFLVSQAKFCFSGSLDWRIQQKNLQAGGDNVSNAAQRTFPQIQTPKDAEEATEQVIRDLYKENNIKLPANPVFREITQPKPGAGFQRVIEREKYKIYSKEVRGTTYIKFCVTPN